MRLAVVYCRAPQGVTAPQVTVEAHLSNGLPRFSIVGLPETAVKESKERVRSAILNSHFEFPTRRITINLAPADVPKGGGRFDLPIALGVLAASNQIPVDALAGLEFAGELALSGELRSVHGALPLALGAGRAGRGLVLPNDNAEEAALFEEVSIFAANHLLEVCAHLMRTHTIAPYQREEQRMNKGHPLLDLTDVRGQLAARRALEIAAAGGHNLLLIGPPGAGKTMLASRLPGILPPLSVSQSLDVAAIASMSLGGFDLNTWQQRPFRAPHHTASAVALVGGGSQPKPGEVSLAHHGVLFLDELPEFERHVLEVLREPLESRQVVISRAAHHVEFPARFQLVAAMNPCPCGHWGDSRGECQCTSEQIQRYRRRLSGPFLDRVDLHVDVPAVPLAELVSGHEEALLPESSAVVRERVMTAHQQQWQRQGGCNADLPVSQLQHCAIEARLQQVLYDSLQRLGCSARIYHRMLRVARTIADLEGSQAVARHHIMEALSYRTLDRRVEQGT